VYSVVSNPPQLRDGHAHPAFANVFIQPSERWIVLQILVYVFRYPPAVHVPALLVVGVDGFQNIGGDVVPRQSAAGWHYGTARVSGV